MATTRKMLYRCQGRLAGAAELIDRQEQKLESQAEGLVQVLVANGLAADVLSECRRLLRGLLADEGVSEPHVRSLLTRVNRALGRAKP